MHIHRSNRVVLLYLLIIWGGWQSVASQTTYTWNASDDKQFGTAANWTPNGIPGSIDNIIISSDTLFMSSSRTVNDVTLSGGIISGSTTLTVDGSMTWSSGEMIGSGTTEISSGASLSIDNSNNVHLYERTLENYGTITWSGDGEIRLHDDAFIYNRGSGLFDIQTDGRLDYVLADNGGRFTNRGTLTKSAGSGRMEIDPVFLNEGGVINANSGTLRFERGSTDSSDGNWNTASGAVLALAEREFFLDGVTFGGNGTVEMVDRATLNILSSGVTVGSAATFVFDTDHQGTSGYIQGSGAITVNGTWDWQEGTFTGNGSITLNDTAYFNTGGTKQLDGWTLSNSGIIFMMSSVRISNSGLLDNLSGAILEMQNDVQFQHNEPGGGTFSNAGTFRKTAGTNTAQISVDASNTGTIDIQSGTLRFSRSLSCASTSVVQGGGTLRVSGISLMNNGEIAPGSSAGILAVTGSITQTTSATMTIEIGGSTPGLTFDQLAVSGTVNLDGTLDVSLINGFEPLLGQEYEIVTANTCNDTFSTVNLPLVDGSPAFAISYEADRVILTALTGGGITANVKVWLEGPYDNNDMNTFLASLGEVSPGHPYSGAPWNYAGSDTVEVIPDGAVDWVLVSLRSDTVPDSTKATRAAFLMSDGSIADLNGLSPLYFEIPADDYYIVVSHRNHLSIMSAATVSLSNGSTLYDFTSGQAQAYGSSPMIAVGGGNYAMIAGDGDSSGSITTADRESVWRLQNGTEVQYAKMGDYNLDGGVDVLDINLIWRNNNGEVTEVP